MVLLRRPPSTTTNCTATHPSALRLGDALLIADVGPQLLQLVLALQGGGWGQHAAYRCDAQLLVDDDAEGSVYRCAVMLVHACRDLTTVVRHVTRSSLLT